MSVKNVALGRAHVLDDAALHLDELLAGFDERLLETADFPRDFRFRHLTLGDDVAGAMQNKNLPAANAGGNGDAAKHSLSFLLPLGPARGITKTAGGGK